MRHKYLPRFLTRVLALGLVALGGLTLGTACSDSTAPAPPSPHLLLSLEVPPSDSLAQLAVSITVARSDSAVLRDVRIYVDSGAGAAPSSATTFCCNGTGNVFWSVVALPGPGRHTVTVVGVDTLGRALSASVAWTVRLSDEPYVVTALPDSGHGGGTRFIHANGTVTGWIGGQDGRQRAALWRGALLTVLATPDSFSATATRVNATGDVLLELQPLASSTTSGDLVRVRRADGMTLVVGPTTFSYPTTNGSVYSYAVCCTIGADLTDTRLAVGATNLVNPGGSKSVVLDVARGIVTDSAAGRLAGLNDAGQSIESVTDASGLYRSTDLISHGFKTAGLPDAQVASVCDEAGRFSSVTPIDFDESANVLASFCANPFWLPPAGGTSRWLDRVVGRSKAIHLSRTGQIIASLDSVGTIYLWRPATNRTTHMQIAGNAWQIDSLAAVNEKGQIAAHGVERATGRAAALLLTPAAAP